LEAEVAGQQGDFIAWNLLGVLYGRERRWDEALAAFAESVKAEPRAADTLVNRGWVLMELRRYDEAAAAFEAALELQPRLARAQAGLGSVLVESKGDYAGGVKHYLTAVRLDPDNARLLNDLGWLSYKMSRYPEAVAALEKAALLDPRSPMIQTNLGLAYQKAGRVEEAVHHLQQALAINAEYTLALYGLGKAYESRKEYAAAGRVYHRAWKQSGNDVYLLLWLQAYMASHGQVVILFLFAFLAVVVVIALRALRARRTLAATKG
jgi:tetratricopeptide (TPR) repeat protein